MSEESLNTRRVQFRIADLLLVTVVVALTVTAAQEGQINGTAYSPILLVVLAGLLGAVTGRLVSDAFRFGFVAGIVLGVLGYLLAAFALCLGIRIADKTLFFVCVSAGGVIGGTIPLMMHRWRRASFRSHMSILLVSVGLLVLLIIRWWTVSEQTRLVAELQAAGAPVRYADVNPNPTIFSSQRISGSVWLRNLLGLRFVRDVTLKEDVEHDYDIQLLVDILPGVENLQLHADHMDDEAFEILNSGKLPRLGRLHVFGRGFGDASLSRLHPLPSLVVLDLEGTSVTDESVKHIASFPRLMVLDVSDTDVTADGVKRLQSKIGRVVSSN